MQLYAEVSDIGQIMTLFSVIFRNISVRKLHFGFPDCRRGTSLCVMTWAPRPEDIFGTAIIQIAPELYILALGEDDGLALRPIRFIPWETTLTTHWIGNWVCLSAGLDAVE
jgi:hypothetical protein